jgi:hypothetical protein
LAFGIWHLAFGKNLLGRSGLQPFLPNRRKAPGAQPTLGQVPRANYRVPVAQSQSLITLAFYPRLSFRKRQEFRSFPAPIRIQNSGRG